jgi:hypothetical protein
MKLINTRLHGILDYGFAFILMLPWISQYYSGDEDTWLLAMAGGLVAIYSLITNYEFGVIRIVPLKFHLVLDVIVGIFLIALPWIASVYNYYFYWPTLLGILIILLAVTTSPTPFIVTKRELDITKP